MHPGPQERLGGGGVEHVDVDDGAEASEVAAPGGDDHPAVAPPWGVAVDELVALCVVEHHQPGPLFALQGTAGGLGGDGQVLAGGSGAQRAGQVRQVGGQRGFGLGAQPPHDVENIGLFVAEGGGQGGLADPAQAGHRLGEHRTPTRSVAGQAAQ